MRNLLLERRPTTATETEAFLSFGDGPTGEILATIERPWIPYDTPGGKPFESCVPDGVYDLIPHARPDGKQVVALVNPSLGVYYQKEDRPNGVGRYLILIHIGNWVTDIVGCIAPGLSFGASSRGRMVKSSANAMRRIMDYIDGDDAQLTIRWIV